MEVAMVEIVGKSDSSFKLIEKILQEEPDFVIISEEILEPQLENDLEKYFPDKNKTAVLFLRNTGNSEKAKSVFFASLNLYQPKNELLKKLSKIIESRMPAGKTSSKSSNLSEREKNILRHVAMGSTNKEIGEKLFISIHTVTTHRKNITQKLGIKTVSGLTVYSILNGI
ncbi:MAG: LuxR C-terminal-related transcriptional regulator, partial [Bacteroidota bacterium]|nr:LuxR C-terminal-related transcriptional regulator [Bacteroidota bacterium]